MEPMYYIGLDVHKRKISYCVKDSGGQIYAEGLLSATRLDLDLWMKTLPQPWSAAMEATMFTGWIYDHLQPHAAALKVAHPLMLRAIAAAKKKNDRIDARKICDCLRCDFLPGCYMASTAIRERRRTLRYRNLLVRPRSIRSLRQDSDQAFATSRCAALRHTRCLPGCGRRFAYWSRKVDPIHAELAKPIRPGACDDCVAGEVPTAFFTFPVSAAFIRTCSHRHDGCHQNAGGLSILPRILLRWSVE
jgi:hypothetical protein